MIVRPGDAPIAERRPPIRPHTVLISEAGGLTGLRVNHETYEPGDPGGEPLWSENTDAVIYVLEGELTVIEDGAAHVLGPGDAAVWPAGLELPHVIENRSALPCSILRMHTRPERDTSHLPTMGLRVETTNGDTRIINVATGEALPAKEVE